MFMKKFCLLVFSVFFYLTSFAQLTPFEISKGKKTTTYSECISFYKQLDTNYEEVKMLTYGLTDVGKPLNLVVLSKSKIFDPKILHQQNRAILLINNGIHPGEPEGIDASMILARDLVKSKSLPDNLIICIIPIYNIDGALNRGSFSRANQNGPEAYGFRGNSQNLDLNRDFIKTDTKNSYAFQQIFNQWNPDVFVDTHVSNGADYQYVMTLIETQKDKLNPILSKFMTQNLVPNLYAEMKKSGFEMTPYVDHIYETPDSGIVGFLETPRFATGYAALHNTIGFITETHMLKPFAQREAATASFLNIIINEVSNKANLIIATRKKANEQIAKQNLFPLTWVLNKDSIKMIDFKGFEGKHKPSEISNQTRLYYDEKEPFTKKIPQLNKFEPGVEVNKPLAYVLPQAWDKAIRLLKLNNVKLQQLKFDTTLTVEMYYLEDYKTSTRPYEGHYLHSNVKLKKVLTSVNFYAGDYVIFTNQSSNRYIVETLEPQATDSYFAWNFFDGILGQKEHFSAYVFEDLAADLLKKDPNLRKSLNEAILSDDKLKNGQAQLNWVYQHSPYFEKTYLRYPVARLITPTKLNLK
jgi:Zinc carboxypeptidase